MKLLYVEHGEQGYILVARRVLYMAGSLPYRGIKHPWFNVHSVQCKKAPYAQCVHFFCVKHTWLKSTIICWKTSLKLLCVEHGVYGYILVALRVLYMAGSLRYLGKKHPLSNAHSVQWSDTPYEHCTHFSHVEYACFQYNVVLKKQFETLVYWKTSVRLHFGYR